MGRVARRGAFLSYAFLAAGGGGCNSELPIVAAGASCGERFCTAMADSCRPRTDGGASDSGTICDWSGAACSAVQCGSGFSATCPAGAACNGSVCTRSGPSGDRTACNTDYDCVAEACCRPTLCVNRADQACRTATCCSCDDCLPPIAGCSCVDGCCVTRYGSGCK